MNKIFAFLANRWVFGTSLLTVSTLAQATGWEVVLQYVGYAAAAVSAVSAIQQANTQKAASKYNEKLAENQAIGAEQEAAAAADRQRRNASKTIGSMQASYAASGVSAEGSPLEVLEESARNAELDRLTILWNGQSRAQGYQNTAELERSRGKNAMASGYLSAAGSAFKGFASAYTPSGGGSTSSTASTGTNDGGYSDNVNQSFIRMVRD